MRGGAQQRILRLTVVQECSRSIWKAASIKLVVWTDQLQSDNGFHMSSHYMENTIPCIHTCDILSLKLIIAQTLHDSTATDRLQKTDDRVFI